MIALALIVAVTIGIVGNELLQGDGRLILLAGVAIAMIAITAVSSIRKGQRES